MLMNGAVTKTLIGRGVFSHIFMFRRTDFFQNNKFEFNLKRNLPAEHEFKNIHLPINVHYAALLMKTRLNRAQPTVQKYALRIFN